jgi:undecaprenyl-diphosphatase
MEYKIVKYFNNNFRHFDKLANLVSTYRFQLVFWWGMTLGIYYFSDQNGKAVLAGALLAVLFHFIVDEGLLKFLLAKYFFRKRPYLAHPDEIVPIGYRQSDSSFPSSHLAIALSIFTVYAYYYWKYWPLMLVFVILLAFARLHKGLHYPSDELAGILLGIIYGATALLIVS